MKQNATDFKVDSDRIGLRGGSASSHLSLLIGLSPEIQFPDNEKNKNDASIAAIVVFASPRLLQKDL
ncbi:hypothetical protein [Psychroflexus torquis]|uniref:hypothetical protein n=1 Tax=Psychroflexus torquis TaxID=57029 RepID=UPI003CCA6E2E